MHHGIDSVPPGITYPPPIPYLPLGYPTLLWDIYHACDVHTPLWRVGYGGVGYTLRYPTFPPDTLPSSGIPYPLGYPTLLWYTLSSSGIPYSLLGYPTLSPTLILLVTSGGDHWRPVHSTITMKDTDKYNQGVNNHIGGSSPCLKSPHVGSISLHLNYISLKLYFSPQIKPNIEKNPVFWVIQVFQDFLCSIWCHMG